MTRKACSYEVGRRQWPVSQAPGDELLTSHELSPCELCSGEEVVEGALFRHRLEIEPAPVIAIVEFTRVQLQMKHGTD